MVKLLLGYQGEIDISAVCAAYEYGHGEVAHILGVCGGHCTWCDLTSSSQAGEGEDMEGEGFAEQKDAEAVSAERDCGYDEL